MKNTWAILKSIIGTYKEHSDIFLSLIDEEGNIVCANSNMVKTLHLKNPRTEKTNFFDLLHPVHLPDFKTAIRNSCESNIASSMEIYLKNGYYHPMKWQVNCLENNSKDKTYLCLGHKILTNNQRKQFNLPGEDNVAGTYTVVSTIADLIAKKKLAMKLKEAKTLYRSFMDQTPNLAWVVDEDSKLVFASRAFYKYFGLDEKSAFNKKIADIIPAVIADPFYEKHKQVLETGAASELTEKIKWADGTDFVFHINIFPVGEFNGIKLLGGHAVNLPDKYDTEKRLRELNDRLLLLTRATSDAIWEWDMQTGRIFRNDALMDMIGYQIDDPKGLSWWLRRIHPDDRNRVSDKVKESTDKNQQSWNDEYRFKCADGKYKYIRDNGYIVYENGLPVKMIGSLQDISKLKQLEDQLTEEKLERQREISELMIHAQEKERTRIGHELHDNVNQILSTTKLFVDMLAPSGKEEKQVKAKSIEYLLLAIEEIRKLSKELVVPELKGHCLWESIETLTEDIHLSTPVKIKFTHDHENDLLSPGKKIALFRITQEQLKNILKHSQAKHVDIFLQNKDGNTQLIIKDDGIGFDSTKAHRGIGLSNIYERTRFYNGAVDIQTKPGKGCTLSVTIPVG